MTSLSKLSPPPHPNHQSFKHHLPKGPSQTSPAHTDLPLLSGPMVLTATAVQFSACVTSALRHSLIILCKAVSTGWLISVCNVCCLLVCLFVICSDAPGDLADKHWPAKELVRLVKACMSFMGASRRTCLWKPWIAYSKLHPILFTDMKSQINLNTFENNHVYFEMTISTFSLCIGWRQLPIFLFPVFGAPGSPSRKSALSL